MRLLPLWVSRARFPTAKAAATIAMGRSHAAQAAPPYQIDVSSPSQTKAASISRRTTAPNAVAAIKAIAAW